MDIRHCAQLLREHDKYLLVTHRRPDGDTLGSAAGLCHALRRLGKTAHLYHNPDITENYMTYVAPYLAPEGYEYETVISVDSAAEKMLAPGFSGRVWMALDHHGTHAPYAEHTLVWEHKASCGELILALVQELHGNLTKEEAELLYVAVSTDTGCFRYGNTKADTFRAAAALLEAGADTPPINKLLFRTKTRARLKLEGLIYGSLQSYKNNAINVAIVTLAMLAESEATENDCDDLANLPCQVAGNRVAITVREMPGFSKVSLRTDGSVDASQICGLFGGGGHKMASGCELRCTPTEAAELVRKAVEEAWV